FDVRAQHVRHLPGRGEVHQPLGAGLDDVGVRLVDVDAAGIHHVSGQQHGGLPVIDGDVRHLVARDGDDVQDAPAQVVLDDLRGPVVDAEEALQGGNAAGRDDGRVGPALELEVPPDVVEVRVQVRDHQGNDGAVVPLQPLVDDEVHRRDDVRSPPG